MRKDIYNTAVNTLYKVREEELILGLSGRTGSGCSTVASILKESFDQINLKYSPEIEESNIKPVVKKLNEEKIKFDTVIRYMEDRWKKFTVIEGAAVILSFILEKDLDLFIDYIRNLCSYDNKSGLSIANVDEMLTKLKNFSIWFDRAKGLMKIEAIDDCKEEETIDTLYEYYINELPDYLSNIRRLLSQYYCKEVFTNNIKKYTTVEKDLYSTLWQRIGNNIRSSGDPYSNDFEQEKYLTFAKRIDGIITLIKKWNKNHKLSHVRICIDAIRNFYESSYLKTKHRRYYLIAISTDELSRVERLDMTRSAKNALDKIEYSSIKTEQQFYHQDLGNCFEKADIHLYNKNDSKNNYIFTKWQLFRYIALMIHPGLITPTHIERCMQLAYVTKLNSGCLSRQVGAVVTGSDYSVKSVGWNDVPYGQISCNLRGLDDYCSGSNNKCYSKYETEDAGFKKCLKRLENTVYENRNLLGGRVYSYCFKDIYNGMTNTNNQIHTRALHAEENAFLQIAKYGGQGLKGGILFSTASPCELCSKKAYQLGIKRIYYIDPYPGISNQHILSFGKSKSIPETKQYYGAIGEAYIELYKQVMPPKDELELITGVNAKKAAKELAFGEEEDDIILNFRYELADVYCKFDSRSGIEIQRYYVIKVEKNTPGIINKKFKWTGSEYIETIANYVTDDQGNDILDYVEDIQDENSPYKYRIHLKRDLLKGDEIKANVVTRVLDSGETMKPFFAHVVRNPTDKLIMRIAYPKRLIRPDSIVNNRYVSENMTIKYNNPKLENDFIITEEENLVKYTVEIDNPILLYTYSIEWKFS